MNKITKFDDFNQLFEFKDVTFSDQELFEMANASEKITGIENVVLWMGPPPASHGHRIKVSNIPNSFKPEDCFIITIPEFKIIGKINKSLINKEKFDDIIKFVELNMKNIILYSEYKMETSDFLNKLIKI
jgi:hypothetical protein